MSSTTRNTLVMVLVAAFLVVLGWTIVSAHSAMYPDAYRADCGALYTKYTNAYDRHQWAKVDTLWAKGVGNGCFHND